MNSIFQFAGRVPPSKSLMNRWLCVASFLKPGELEIDGDSRCDDVVRMRAGLAQLLRGDPVECGAAGTVFRFLVLRASRIPGRHILKGTPRLLARPQGPLVDVLKTLGVKAALETGDQGSVFVVEGKGWKPPRGPLTIDRSLSSQFVSSLVLNAWNLPFPLNFQGSESSVSDSYFEMTLQVVREAGMLVEERPDRIIEIPAGQLPRAGRAQVEPDMSSAFAVGALGAVGGEARLLGFPEHSLQPDRVFPEILKAMGVTVIRDGEALVFRRVEMQNSDGTTQAALRGVEWNLRDCPDLFPVLAVLCALAEGPSRLYGAAHLVHKESNRIDRIATLISLLGREFRVLPDGMEFGPQQVPLPKQTLVYDSSEDHRLVMAASVLNAAGARILVNDPHCVAKSYPEFLDFAPVLS